jgi:hypothetical protein
MRRFLAVASVAALSLAGIGYIFLTFVRPIPQHRLESQPARFSTCPIGETALLLDTVKGDTWIFRRARQDGEPVWLPVPSPEKVGGNSDRLAVSGAAEPGGQAADSRPALRSILEREGYTRVQVNRLGSGYLTVAVRFDGMELSLIIDTGAPRTQLDWKRLQRLREISQKPPEARKSESIVISGSGSPGSFELAGFRTRELRIGNTDLDELNTRNSQKHGDPPVDGLLGADVLDAHLAVIDYWHFELYLLGRGSGD